jgi:hypothetical protein
MDTAVVTKGPLGRMSLQELRVLSAMALVAAKGVGQAGSQLPPTAHEGAQAEREGGSDMRHFGSSAVIGGIFIASLLAGCGSGDLSPGASAGDLAGPSDAPSAPTPGDPFAGLPYRLDLPEDWVVLASDAYDASLDTAPDVADWLKQLDLIGPNAFRAYEPLPGGVGLRIAINPSTRNATTPGPLQDGSVLAKLPGVTAEPEGDWVPIGAVDKGSRFRWTQTLDWGSGSPSARTCVGYVAMGQYDPVNVVFSYPAATDRLADVDALMASFEVTGNPVVSMAPGTTPTPSPTPFDKFASTEPMQVTHNAPELEALLPDSAGGLALSKQSSRGDLAGMTATDPILARFGKQPSDYAAAQASPNQPPLLIIAVERLTGVAADDLLAAKLKLMPDAEVSRVQLGGHAVTYVMYGAWPVWYYPSGSLLYGVAGLEDRVAAVLQTLP